MNPEALKAAIEEAAASAGAAVPRVAVVLGDDLTAEVCIATCAMCESVTRCVRCFVSVAAGIC